MLPPEARLPEIESLIERGQYFVVHAPRQSGKTTLFRALAERLLSETRFTTLLASCETGQTARADLERGVDAILHSLEFSAGSLPASLRPPQPREVDDQPAETRLKVYLSRWCERSPRPVVLFLDEIDALRDDTLVSILRQLRSGYLERPERFPHALALIGLRDVRDYRVDEHERGTLGTASPFNIKVRSLTLRNFSPDEVASLLRQHTEATGQRVTEDAVQEAFEQSRGQPWLVNALAQQVVEVEARDAEVIEVTDFDRAAAVLIERRDTHLDSLIERLREPRVQRVIEPILTGSLLAPDLPIDDLRYVEDLGLIVRSDAGLEIANPIYREIVPRALAQVTQDTLPVHPRAYVAADGTLRFEQMLDAFVEFWLENAELYLARQPYSEAAAQLVFMAYLQRVVNGGGTIEREYAVGSGRVDLLVRWPAGGLVQRFAVELKVWRDRRPDPVDQGLEQLKRYLERLRLDQGTLVIFDARSIAPPLPERLEMLEQMHEDRSIRIVRL